jgi:hypothetical protein
MASHMTSAFGFFVALIVTGVLVSGSMAQTTTPDVIVANAATSTFFFPPATVRTCQNKQRCNTPSCPCTNPIYLSFCGDRCPCPFKSCDSSAQVRALQTTVTAQGTALNELEETVTAQGTAFDELIEELPNALAGVLSDYLVIDSDTLNFGSTGWAGWDCPSGYYPVSGGIRPSSGDCQAICSGDSCLPGYPVGTVGFKCSGPGGSASGMVVQVSSPGFVGEVWPHNTYINNGWAIQAGDTGASVRIRIICVKYAQGAAVTRAPK